MCVLSTVYILIKINEQNELASSFFKDIFSQYLQISSELAINSELQINPEHVCLTGL